MFLFKNLKRKSVNLIYNRLFHEWNRTHNSKWNYHLLYWFYIPLMYYTYSLFTFHFTFNKRVRLLLRSLINSNHFCHSLQFKILFNYINTRSEMELVERNMVHYVERIIRHKAVIRTRQKCEYDESCVEVGVRRLPRENETTKVLRRYFIHLIVRLNNYGFEWWISTVTYNFLIIFDTIF